jgi:hypothetical protein
MPNRYINRGLDKLATNNENKYSTNHPRHVGLFVSAVK